MGFSFGSFVGGAATSFSEAIDKYEREAAKNAEIQMNLMTKNYMERKEELSKLRNESVEDAKFIAGLYVNEKDNPMFEDMVFAVTQNPSALAQIKKASQQEWFDPSKTTLASLYTPLTTAPSGKKAVEQIDHLLNINNAITNISDYNLSVNKEKSGNIFRTVGESNARGKANNLLKTVADSLGTTPEQMAGAMQFKRPVAEIKGKFDYSKLKAPLSEAMATNVYAGALAAQAYVKNNPNATPEDINKAAEAVVKAKEAVQSFINADPQKLYANKKYDAILTLGSSTASKEDKAAAKQWLDAVDNTTWQKKEAEAFAKDQYDAIHGETPEIRAAAEARVRQHVKNSSTRQEKLGLLNFSEAASSFKAVANSALKGTFSETGQITTNAVGDIMWKGDPKLIKGFNETKFNAIAKHARNFYNPDVGTFSPSYVVAIEQNLPPGKTIDDVYASLRKPQASSQPGTPEQQATAPAPTPQRSLSIDQVIDKRKEKKQGISINELEEQVALLEKSGVAVTGFDDYKQRSYQEAEAVNNQDTTGKPRSYNDFLQANQERMDAEKAAKSEEAAKLKKKKEEERQAILGIMQSRKQR